MHGSLADTWRHALAAGARLTVPAAHGTVRCEHPEDTELPTGTRCSLDTLWPHAQGGASSLGGQVAEK